VWRTIRQRTAQLCAARRTGLTPLREAVLAELWRADKPLGAYDLAARISESGESRIAPNTI
jgi:Fe2+ or Zn2+ uptake regulation protein